MFTAYGQQLAKAEKVPTIVETGALASMRACHYDSGLKILLTGKNFQGRRFERYARSVYGAFFTMRAVAGIERAWHIRDDGSRRLIFRR